MDASLAAADLLIGAQCAGCGVAARGLCDRCVRILRPQPFLVERPQVNVPIVASGRYEAELRSSLVAWKEHDFERLTPLWSHHVAASLAVLVDDQATVVKIPARPGRTSRHRFDQVVIAATQQLAGVGVGVRVAPILNWTRVVHAQKRLDRQQRRHNIRGALVAEPSSGADSPMVIVDDVVTTGATLAVAAAALRRRGYDVLGCAVIAATDRSL